MVVTSKGTKRTASENNLQRERIEQDKARARRWAKQRRKERNARAILPTEHTITATAVPLQNVFRPTSEATVTATTLPSQNSHERSQVL